jgi:hypothetical protein
MGDIARINKQIVTKYGTILDGRPRFRVVWSSDQLEKRRGEFSDWYGHILIRTVEETREVLKYPGPDDRDRWIVESIIFQPWPDLPESTNGHYEPLWTFRTAEGKYLKPNWNAVDFLLNSLLFGVKKTISDRVEEDRKKFAEEVMFFKEFFDNKAPYIATMLKEGHAITVPSNYEKGE